MGKKRVKIYNKGGRTWPLPVGFDKNKKQVLNDCGPGKSIELDEAVANRMVKNYPDDFIHGESMAVSGNSTKALNAQIKKLTAENAELKEELAETEGILNDLKEKLEAEETAEANNVNQSLQ